LEQAGQLALVTRSGTFCATAPLVMIRPLRRLLLGLAGLCLASCLSPTLPLPPPSKPDVSSPDDSGYVRLQGIAAPRAEVIAWNHASDIIAGQVTGETPRYDFQIKAEVSDVIELWYIQGSDESSSVRVVVPEPEAP
jgi:hypothetical protein